LGKLLDVVSCQNPILPHGIQTLPDVNAIIRIGKRSRSVIDKKGRIRGRWYSIYAFRGGELDFPHGNLDSRVMSLNIDFLRGGEGTRCENGRMGVGICGMAV
jgi:hypothetical protein